MKIDWQHATILLVLVGAAVAQALSGQFTAGSVAAILVTVLAAVCSALKASIVPSVNVTAAIKSKLPIAAAGCLLVLGLAACPPGTGAVIVSDITAIGRCELAYIADSPAPTPEGAIIACAGLLIGDATSTFTWLEGTASDAGAPTPTAAKIRAARLAKVQRGLAGVKP